MTEGHEDYLGDLWDLLPTDPTDFIEDDPTEDEAEKAPSSEWVFDHDADVNRHHTKFTIAEHDLAARHGLAVLDPLVCSEAEAGVLIENHRLVAAAHHTKFTAANARTAINDIFGADGKADANIDLDGQDLIGGDVIVPANGSIGVTDGNPKIVFDNANNRLETVGDMIIGGTSQKNIWSDFEVQGNYGLMAVYRGTNNPNSPSLFFYKDRSGGVITSGDQLFDLRGYAHDGVDHATCGGQISFVSTGVIAENRVPTQIIFRTAAGVADNDLANRMLVSPSGIVTIINLAGVGDRAVMVNAGGVLSAP